MVVGMKAKLCTIRPSSYRPDYFVASVVGFTTGGKTVDEAKAAALDGYAGALRFRVLETPELNTTMRHAR